MMERSEPQKEGVKDLLQGAKVEEKGFEFQIL